MCVCRANGGIELRAMQDTCVQRLLELGIWPEEAWPLQRFRQRLI